jgi:hypothetical protein
VKTKDISQETRKAVNNEKGGSMATDNEDSIIVNYWIFKVKDEEGGLFGRKAMDIFLHRTKEGFWGIREVDENGKRESNVSLLKKGDRAVFYLVGKTSSSFIGTCTLDSEYVTLDTEQSNQLVHREFIDPNQGVFITDLNRWEKPLKIDLLRGETSFIKRSGKFGPFFQGSIKKIKHPDDYRAIIAAHKQHRNR